MPTNVGFGRRFILVQTDYLHVRAARSSLILSSCACIEDDLLALLLGPGPFINDAPLGLERMLGGTPTAERCGEPRSAGLPLQKEGHRPISISQDSPGRTTGPLKRSQGRIRLVSELALGAWHRADLRNTRVPADNLQE